ncbi:SCO0930 family lipoprotein [Streptomyces gardneri]|uniref:Lipoprotein n=1 Tax=Streptomyces gardneri TaxID=66892 RepID=A0A4Y3RYI8_9ACTN|nr:SCO0930 family lipoprotein [Streptomyces gardneri]GEB62359.1 lipoprotein [Streptomyces gardneri]GHH24306.1 lipoprotein [Streptomyces gardneri]
MTNLNKLTIAAAGTALVLGLTACGPQESGAGSAGPAAPAGASASTGSGSGSDGYGATPSGGAAATASGPLVTRQDPRLGTVVTDAAGFTLYRFDKDTAKPSASNCDGDCAKAWPPVPAGSTQPGDVKASRTGSVDRADGTKQLTIAGWPVYRFAKDTAPGQTNGQGVGGTWFAVTPDGKKAGTTAPEADEDGTGKPLPALSLRNDDQLGRIIQDGKGRTLYRFTKDTAWPMKSNCEGACLEKWRPAKPVDVNDIDGIDPKKLIILTRPDGTKQLTIDCWPLYWFTGDKTPGDTNGQGVGSTWFAVTADGKLAK